MNFSFDKIAIMSDGQDVNYHEMLRHVSVFAGQTSGEKPSKTLIFSENRIGWVYAFFSVWQNRSVAVPVDASATVSDLDYILRDCQPETMWVSMSRAKIAKQAIEASGIDVRMHIIEEAETLPTEGVEENPDTIDRAAYDANAISLIIYTSGTTGNPKGVMLSYGNLWANIHGVADEVPIFTPERRTLVLLPVHHVLPLMGTIIAPIMIGGGIIICETLQAADIMNSLCRGKVAIFIGVPRLWQMLYAGIMKKINASAATRALYNMCAKAHSRALSRFVFQSVRKKMGGHLDFCVSGGAALDKEIGEGLTTLGLDVLEGYGMTETAPIISFTRPGDFIPGCAGKPLPSVECKIVDGELCAKGANLMLGYYNRPEETSKVIDADGFIHTGDLARFDEDGRVYITGRTKEIIVLSNGKNVQPNEIEYKLEKYDTRVKEAAVMQNGDMLMAIIVPQEKWAEGKSDEDIEAALKREVIEPYNLTVTNYKKLMSIFVYHGELPRTKLDKLQRFKLKDIVSGHRKEEKTADAKKDENVSKEYRILSQYIADEKKTDVHPEDHLEVDLAFDSLDKVGLQSFIEQSFGVSIKPEEMSTVKAIAARVEHEKTHVDTSHIDWHEIMTSDSSSLQLPHASALYTTYAKMFKGYFRLYNRLSVKGRENIPANGPYIIAPNHQSFLDGALAVVGMDSKTLRDCYFYATEEHVKGKTLKKMAQDNNIILMERKNLKNSILKLAEVLKQGKNIVIFPEGSRTHDGEMGMFKKTFAILSKELGVPVVPVCINGAYKALPRGTHYMKPSKISVEYLPPVYATINDTYDSIINRVRDEIQKILR